MQNNHTFVICAYGDSRYLEECIQSLGSQSLKTNIILYTSTPSDYINGLCEEYQIPYYSSPGGGIGKDWNNALSFVQTQFATIVHQDDVYLTKYAEKILSSMTDETLIAYSDYQEVKEGEVIALTSNLKIKQLMLRTLAIFPKWKFWRNRVLAFGNPISCPAVTYNLKKLNDFKFNEEMKVSLDWFAWYQIAQKNGSFTFVDENLMYHRIHEESETTNSIENNIRTKEDYEMYLLFWPTFIAKFLLRYYVKSQDTNGGNNGEK
ncbi:TPA: glycosyltransferase family 2 protein [Streptococcus suis]|nr:glycosyltransferase family 2 protein [Streptococcus suis]HEM2582760.1 glycosyltransferase family 2 protein [Streptococcus suis]